MLNKIFTLAFLMIIMVNAEILSAQTPLVLYTFGSSNRTLVFDESGNGNDATLVGGANIFGFGNSLCQVGMGATDYLSVPPVVLNGLEDFTIDLKVKIQKARDKSVDPMNTFFSASSLDCIYCLGLAYQSISSSWLVTLNGVTHTFPGSLIGFKHTLIRKDGTVSLYVILNNEMTLIGSFFDDSPMEYNTFLLGQQEHCLEGCFQGNQGLFGAYNNFRVFGEALFKISEEENDDPAFTVYPDPISSNSVIEFTLLQTSPIKIDLFDLQGRIIKTIAEGNFEAGDHQLKLSNADLSKGMYVLRFKSDEASYSTELIVN